MLISAASATPAALTWKGVTAWRMARHFLAEPATDLDPAGIASVLCGAHAQVLSAAELSIGRRIAGATRSDVRRALWQERALVKSFGPRGTVHLLPAADLPVWTGAMSALPFSAPQQPDGVRFTPGQADEVIAAIAERVGRWAVDEKLEAFGGKWPRWRQLTSTAGHRGTLCFGPDRGRNVTYTSPRRWLPGFRPADGAAALRTLLTRYLHAYGPATPRHFARFLGIPPRLATDLFTRLDDQLERVQVDGVPGWILAGDTGVPAPPHHGIRLMPYFDPYVVGGQPRDWLYPGVAAARALNRTGQAGTYPVLLVDGVVGGVWHCRRSGGKLAITVDPVSELTAAHRRQLGDEVDLVASVMEGTATLTIGAVTAGPHA